MKIAFLLIILLLAVGCESKQTQTAPSKPKSRPIVEATFEGGDGSSIEKAIIIRAKTDFDGIRAEYSWIRKKYPAWQLEEQRTLNVRGGIYDKMDFRIPDGQRTTLFFDITDFHGKM